MGQSQGHVTPTQYEFRVAGRPGTDAAMWFEEMSISIDGQIDPPQTLLRGQVIDQAALYGLISRIRDLGLTLISVTRIE